MSQEQELILYGYAYAILLMGLPLFSVIFFIHHELENYEKRAVPSSFARDIWIMLEAYLISYALMILVIMTGEIYSDYTGYNLFDLAKQAIEDTFNQIFGS